MDGFGLDFVKKMERGFRSAMPNMGAVLQRSMLDFIVDSCSDQGRTKVISGVEYFRPHLLGRLATP